MTHTNPLTLAKKLSSCQPTYNALDIKATDKALAESNKN